MIREKKFTPGPWEITTCLGDNHSGFRAKFEDGDTSVPHSSCWVESGWCGESSSEISRANDHLISAAPELLEALELARDKRPVVCACGLDLENQKVLEVIESAIKKAYGETP